MECSRRPRGHPTALAVTFASQRPSDANAAEVLQLRRGGHPHRTPSFLARALIVACFPSVLPVRSWKSQAGWTPPHFPGSVTATPTAQCHAERAQAAVLPTVVVLLLFVHDHGGSLRLRRRVVWRRLLRRRIVAALWWHLETRLRRRVVGVLLRVAHHQAGLKGSLTDDAEVKKRESYPFCSVQAPRRDAAAVPQRGKSSRWGGGWRGVTQAGARQ